MRADPTRPTPFQLLVRIAVQVTLGLYLVGAVAWWWASPGGFPIGHLKFWSNGVVPVVVFLAAGTGLGAMWTGRQRLLAATMVSFSVLTLSAAIVAAVVFPISSRRLLLFGTPIVITQALFAANALRQQRTAWSMLASGCSLAVISATVMVFAQRGPHAHTHPRDMPMPVVAGDHIPRRSRVELNPRATVDSRRGIVDVRCRHLRIECQPLLTFHDHSPDRCWSILRPHAMRELPRLKLSAADLSTNQVKIAYGVDASLLADGSANDVLQLEAFCRLPQPVYSHLNSFCELTISGHERLFLRFSACPDITVEALPADYPVGRPARMAFINADGEFQVVEASSGEKGPFKKLANGRIRRDMPLSITLIDAKSEVCRIVFDDWAAQADTQRSPTAGWGLPVNALEFQRTGDNASAVVTIWISLAATSVGRGWDTVGHAAGVYRNRMRIETIGETE